MKRYIKISQGTLNLDGIRGVQFFRDTYTNGFSLVVIYKGDRFTFKYSTREEMKVDYELIVAELEKRKVGQKTNQAE